MDNFDSQVVVNQNEENPVSDKDPKGARITVRISQHDLQDLQREAQRRSTTVGAVVRALIRENLAEPADKAVSQ